MRDSQRQKVYDAENRVFGNQVVADLTMSEMQALVDKWGASKVLRRRYPRARLPVEVRDGRGRRTGNYSPHRFGPDVIKMPRWFRRRCWLAHEYAHHLAYAPGRAWHSWEFAEAYLYLVRVFLAKSSEERLKAEFRAGKVKFKPPRTRTMTDGQREAARQRMLALHARKAEAVAAGSPR